MRVEYRVYGRTSDSAAYNWVYLDFFLSEVEAEDFILDSRNYQDYKIDKIWSWPF